MDLAVFGSNALRKAEVFIIYSPLGGLALFVCIAIEKRIETARLCPRVIFSDLALSLSNWTLGKFLISTTDGRTEDISSSFLLSLSPSGAQLASYADQIAIVRTSDCIALLSGEHPHIMTKEDGDGGGVLQGNIK